MKKLFYCIIFLLASFLSCLSEKGITPYYPEGRYFPDKGAFVDAMSKHIQAGSAPYADFVDRLYSIYFSVLDTFRYFPPELIAGKNIFQIFIESKPEWSITTTTKSLVKMTKLQVIVIFAKPNFTKIPKELANLPNLRELYLHANNLKTVPKCLLEKESLRMLSVEQNPLESIELNNVNRKNELTLIIDSTKLHLVKGKKFKNIIIKLHQGYSPTYFIGELPITIIGQKDSQFIIYEYYLNNRTWQDSFRIYEQHPLWNEYKKNNYIGKRFIMGYKPSFHRIFFNRSIK